MGLLMVLSRLKYIFIVIAIKRRRHYLHLIYPFKLNTYIRLHRIAVFSYGLYNS